MTHRGLQHVRAHLKECSSDARAEPTRGDTRERRRQTRTARNTRRHRRGQQRVHSVARSTRWRRAARNKTPINLAPGRTCPRKARANGHAQAPRKALKRRPATQTMRHTKQVGSGSCGHARAMLCRVATPRPRPKGQRRNATPAARADLHQATAIRNETVHPTNDSWHASGCAPHAHARNPHLRGPASTGPENAACVARGCAPNGRGRRAPNPKDRADPRASRLSMSTRGGAPDTRPRPSPSIARWPAASRLRHGRSLSHHLRVLIAPTRQTGTLQPHRPTHGSYASPTVHSAPRDKLRPRPHSIGLECKTAPLARPPGLRPRRQRLAAAAPPMRAASAGPTRGAPRPGPARLNPAGRRRRRRAPLLRASFSPNPSLDFVYLLLP